MIEYDIGKRWEQGIPHHYKSIEIEKIISEGDRMAGYPLDMKFGGDGDEGETLLYILDIYFEEEDIKMIDKIPGSDLPGRYYPT